MLEVRADIHLRQRRYEWSSQPAAMIASTDKHRLMALMRRAGAAGNVGLPSSGQ